MDKAELIVDLLKVKFPGVLAIYQYGSAGTQYETPMSDIDLAILITKKVKPIECWHVAQALAKELNKDVDLVDLIRASTVLQYQVITEGKQLWVCNEDNERRTVDLFETTVITQYQHLQEERKIVIDALIAGAQSASGDTRLKHE